jgi:predicted N-acyltransferase
MNAESRTDSLTVTLHSAIAEIAETEWDACACPEAADGGPPRDPFTTHRFLKALEESGSVGPGTGWEPHHLAVRQGDSLIAVAPCYAKGHSQGEYIFDHGWADAYERAGGRYYPKLQVAVPFTPATGRRLLARPGQETAGRAALVTALTQVAEENRLSSAHITFCTAEEAALGEAAGLLRRSTQQFHWENRGYADFDAFLADLASRKRKAIRKERATAQGFGGTIRQLTGAEIGPEHWAAMWTFYQDTGSRKWGRPYLTREFFDLAADRLAEDVLMVVAERDGRPVAGALNLIGRDTLFGRYWGCVEDHACLHFECCYYQAIDAAIARGLGRVEAGAQGEHKLARGYLPSETHSLHWIADRGFRAAVSRFLEQERAMLDEEMTILTDYGPFRRVTQDE